MKKLMLVAVLALGIASCCKENDSCYDSSLVHDNFCTADCPGFLGCDGKTYCNECEAARKGIGPK